MFSPSTWLALSIIGLSFITEDGATALAAGVGGGALDLRLAFLSCFLGIWVGDLGLYAAARSSGQRVLSNRFAQRFLPSHKLSQAEQWFRQRGIATLILSRIIPGTRLPTFVAAGTLRMPFTLFAGVTATCAAVWVAAAFAIARIFPSLWLLPNGAIRNVFAAAMPVATGLLGLMIARPLIFSVVRKLRAWWRKYRRWEFWPAWLFYTPVALMGAWLAVRYRGLALPTVANPSQRNGGLIGESKIEILTALMKLALEVVADAYLIAPAASQERMRTLENLLTLHAIEFPFVLKPDVGQRGDGFRKIWSLCEAQEYLATVHSGIVLQRYAPGPFEAGIFYYRLPGEQQGHIFAITEKFFPTLTGDGMRTLRELIAADERAALMADIYLGRFADMVDRVLPPGESVRLVEAGNHCQGCVFQDGMHLYSERLRAAIDRISQSLPEFYIGRYDVRYSSAEEFREGRGFTILELNGSASEATSIYDSRNSLWSAYKTLYRQWELVYQIGEMNRDRGYKPAGIGAVMADWFAYQRMAASYPAAD